MKLLQTIKAVLWSFFGVRSRQGYEKEVTELNPIAVILVGLVMAMLFVVLLIITVNILIEYVK